MPTRPDAPFPELLLLDVALMAGHLDGRKAAMVLLRWWDHRDRPGAACLSEVLRTTGGLSSSAVATIQAEADALVGKHGDARSALELRGGLDAQLRSAVAHRDARASLVLGKSGVPVRAPLRPAPADRYLDFMPVGQGGMGVVYWALDTEMNRQVAFKVVRPPGPGAELGITPPAPMAFRAPDASGAPDVQSDFQDLTARFLMEAWITGGMEHPGIVPVYEVGRTEQGVPYYTMRFVRGQRTLLSAIRDMDGRTMSERLSLVEPFLRVCDTIRYAHARGVIHRDLKPENVALGEYGEVVVLDWGLAKPIGRMDRAATRWKHRVAAMREARDLRTLTSAIGTPGYMAPEAVRGEITQLDERSDVYALGVMLFQILTGTLPFDPRSGEDYESRVTQETAPRADARSPNAPQALARLCELAMSIDPALRPADVETFTGMVRDWQRDKAQRVQFDQWLGQGRTAIELAEAAEPETVRRHLEVAGAAAHRVLEVDPDHSEARALQVSVRERGADMEAAVARQSRLRLLRLSVAVGLLAIAVVAGVSAWLLEQRREEAETARGHAVRARSEMSEQRDRAESTMDLMVDTIWEDMAESGRLASLVKIGTAAQDHYAALDPTGDTPERFTRRMRALHLLAEALVERGHLRRARSVLEEAGLAGQAYARTRGADARRAQRLLLRTEAALSEVDLQQGLSHAGIKRATRLVTTLNQALADRPEDPVSRTALVRAYHARGQLHRLVLATDKAQADAEAALRHADALPAARSFVDERLRLRAVRLGIHVGANERPGEDATVRSDDLIREADALAQRYPDDLRADAFRCEARFTRGYMMFRAGRHAEALPLVEEARQMMAGLVRLRPDNRNWIYRLCVMRVYAADLRSGYWTSTSPRDPELYAPHAAVYRDAYVDLSQLLEIEDSSVRWLNQAVTLCDRLAQSIKIGVPAFGMSELDMRKRALGYAQRILALDPENQRYATIQAYTIGALLLEPTPEHMEIRRRGLALASRSLSRPGATEENLGILAMNVMPCIAMAAALGDHVEAAEIYTRTLRLLREASPAPAGEARRQIMIIHLVRGAPGRIRASDQYGRDVEDARQRALQLWPGVPESRENRVLRAWILREAEELSKENK